MLKRLSFVVGMMVGVAGLRADVVSVHGSIENPNEVHGRAVSYRLAGDTTFGWRTGRMTGDLDIAGHTFTMDTGNGNTVHLAGRITGTGTIIWQGGGPGPSQKRPSFLEGDQPNTFSGTLMLDRGLLVLAKREGVTAVAGPLVLGRENWAGITWRASHQVADHVPVTFTGKHLSTFDLGEHSETLGTLTLESDGEIILGPGANVLQFADSSAMNWQDGRQLIIRNWQKQDRVTFGGNRPGLTAQQVAQIGFANPEGREPGLYRARMQGAGNLVPGERVMPVNPPFDLSPRAIREREQRYQSDGLERFAQAIRGRQEKLTITFFGDSITWLGGYIKQIANVVEREQKGDLITLNNRGIDGGGARHLRDGAGGLFNQRQEPMANVLAQDKPNIVVIFIGVNDVHWLNTEPQAFREALTTLIDTTRRAGAKPIIATLMVVGERPDGGNPLDQRLDQFANITLEVAKANQVPAVELRSIVMAYLMNHNVEVRLDGSLHHEDNGLLTYDGIHPTDRGNELIASHFAGAIAEVLKGQGR